MTPTREQILAEPAGARLDGWVAEALGWSIVTVTDAGDFDVEVYRHLPRPLVRVHPDGCFLERQQPYKSQPWKPSKDIAAAWEVVEAMAARGCDLVLQDWRRLPQQAAWAALYELPTGHDTGHCLGETAPLAICRCALLAARNAAPGD